MADYWKSQPRKFCQYCKCWIADNKPSIEFHERGKNHKQNVTAKIEEIKKKSIDKAKKEEKMSKEFAAMEEAAMKAFQEDMKRLQGESVVPEAPARSQTKAQKKKVNITPVTRTSSKSRAWVPETKVTCTSSESDAWVQGTTDDGITYYYNTLTGESQWEKPEEFKGESVSQDADQTELTASGSVWMEAQSPDGYTYYYNTETGESSWEKPADYSPEKESPEKESPEKESPEKESPEKESPEKESPTEESSAEEAAGQEAAGQEAHSNPQSESLSGEEDSSEAQTDITGQRSQVPKISFRKRKEEAIGAEEEEADDEGKSDQAVESAAAHRETPVKKARKATPYGQWEKIQEEEDPYKSVDLQLPQTESGPASSTSSDLPREPKTKFKERTITSLGDEHSSEATFRKRKSENGKPRSLRQRGKED